MLRDPSPIFLGILTRYRFLKRRRKIINFVDVINNVSLRSSVPFCIVNYNIKWGIASWTYSSNRIRYFGHYTHFFNNNVFYLSKMLVLCADNHFYVRVCRSLYVYLPATYMTRDICIFWITSYANYIWNVLNVIMPINRFHVSVGKWSVNELQSQFNCTRKN